MFAALAFVAVIYMFYKYKSQRINQSINQKKKDTKNSDENDESKSTTVKTKFDTSIIPLKPPRNDSFSKALPMHYRLNYSHSQYDDNNKFKVVTFNCLASCYALKSSSYSSYCPKEHLQGRHRFTQIGKILQSVNADIIALQEVDDANNSLKWMQLSSKNTNYRILYHKRTRKKQDGLVLAFKLNKFQMYKSSKMHVIKLNDLSLGASSISSQEYFKKDQIAIYCILHSIKDPNHLYFVMNAHLYWHPQCDDIRLRQINYLLNIINAKCTKIKAQNDKIRQISLLFCGDFNTLPQTLPYDFMLNGHFTMRAKGNSSLKLMFDASLNKVCRWTRSLGVDCRYFEQQKIDTLTAEKLFEICRSEDRILVTLSKRLCARRDIPSHLLLSTTLPRDNLKELVKYFGIKYDKSTIFTRCALCNGLFEIVNNLDEIRKNEQVPSKMKIDAHKFTFWRCLQCAQMYWFGEKSKSEVVKFESIFEEALNEIDKEAKEKRQKLKKRLLKRRTKKKEDEEYDSDIGDVDKKINLLPNVQRYFWENVSFKHPFGQRIKSSFFEKNAKNPKYTNKTNKFEGCLDYIFFANLMDDKGKRIKCVDSELIEGDGNYYPNSSWPSDHILLMSTFQVA